MRTSFSLTGKLAKKAAVFIFWIGVWQTIYLIVGKDILVASPIDVARRIVVLSAHADFWINISNSLLHIMLGFFIAIVLGIVFAAISFRFGFVRDAMSGIVNVIKATPVASFILLALVFIKVSRLSIFTSFLMTFPIIWTNTLEGLGQADGNLLEMAKMFKLSRKIRFVHIYFPSLLPYLVSACKIGIGFAWKSGIAAEVLARPVSTIGKSLYESKIYLETLDLFAWTVVIIILSMALERLFMFLMNVIFGKYYKGTEVGK